MSNHTSSKNKDKEQLQRHARRGNLKTYFYISHVKFM